MGVLVTLLFIPEVACLDLSEGDKRWEALKAGKPGCMLKRNHHSQLSTASCIMYLLCVRYTSEYVVELPAQ